MDQVMGVKTIARCSEEPMDALHHYQSPTVHQRFVFSIPIISYNLYIQLINKNIVIIKPITEWQHCPKHTLNIQWI